MLGSTVIAGSIALLALIVSAVILASVCSFAADLVPEPEPPSLPTSSRPASTATAMPAPTAPASDVPAPPALAPASAAPEVVANAGNFAGSWLVREYVIEGPGAGQLTTYELRLVQDGAALTGSGGGLTLHGRVQGQTADLEYSRIDGGTGVFTWTPVREGIAAGVSTRSGGGKGLISMQRLP